MTVVGDSWQRGLIELLSANGRTTTLADVSSGGHSSLHETYRVQLSDGGPALFVKRASGGNQIGIQALAAEAEGLYALAESGGLAVPESVLFCERSSLLCMELISPAPRPPGFDERLGRGVAEIHRDCGSPEYGWHRTNYLGATPQLNTPCDDWPEFFATRRLEPQLRLAVDRGLSTPSLERDIAGILDQLGERIASDEPPCLIHGDLWSGNVLANASGQPVLIDPACSYSDRLAELGMTRLFGGFSESFYDAYSESWPLPPAWSDRVEHYTLYHLLNHLNLFGHTYLPSVEQLAHRLA